MADIELLTTRHAKEIIDNDNKNKNEIISNINDISKLLSLYNGAIKQVSSDTVITGLGFVIMMRSSQTRIVINDNDYEFSNSETKSGVFIPFKKLKVLQGSVHILLI